MHGVKLTGHQALIIVDVILSIKLGANSWDLNIRILQRMLHYLREYEHLIVSIIQPK